MTISRIVGSKHGPFDGKGGLTCRTTYRLLANVFVLGAIHPAGDELEGHGQREQKLGRCQSPRKASVLTPNDGAAMCMVLPSVPEAGRLP